MNRKLWENLVSLYSVHVFTYIVPLITLPYLARVLGPSRWGALAFAEALAAYISLVVEYGFGFSASRDIAQARHDAALRANILSGVLGAQLFLSGVALACTILVGLIPQFGQYRAFLPIAFILAVTRAAYPSWYFQGLERMPLISMMNILGNLAAAVSLFFFVHSPKDNLVPLYIRATVSTILLGPAFFIVFRNTAFTLPTLHLTKRAIISGGSIFLNKSAVSLYTTANVLVLGLIAPSSSVAWFAGAEKITRAAAGAVSPITQSFYPRLSYLLKHDPQKAARTGMISVWLTIGAGIGLGIILLAGAPLLVQFLLGNGYKESIPVLRLFSLMPPLLAGSNVFGIQWMFALRLDREVNTIVLLGGILSLGLSFTLAPHYKQIGMAISLVAAEAFVTGSMFAVLYFRKLGPWQRPQEVAVAA